MTCGADVAPRSWNAVNFPAAFIMALVPVGSAGTSPGRNGEHVPASPLPWSSGDVGFCRDCGSNSSASGSGAAFPL